MGLTKVKKDTLHASFTNIEFLLLWMLHLKELLRKKKLHYEYFKG